MVDSLGEKVDKCPLNRVQLGVRKVFVIWSSGVSAIQGFLMSMEKWLELSELSVISWVSTVERCPLSRVPL